MFASRAGAHVTAGVHALPVHARSDIVDAVQTVFIVAAPLAALALVVVLGLPELPLRTAGGGPQAQPAQPCGAGSSDLARTGSGARER